MRKSFIITGLLSTITSIFLLHAAIFDPICSFDSFTGIEQTSTNGLYHFNVGNRDRSPEFRDGKAIFDGSSILNITTVSNPGGTDIAKLYGNTGATITMTISRLAPGNSTPQALFTASTGWGVGLKNDEDTSKIAGMWSNAIWGDSRNTGTDIPSGSFVLTATSLGNKTSIYINGTLAKEIDGLGSSTAAGFKYLAIGDVMSGGSPKGAVFELENFYIHNQALNASQVADFVASIPEPATASLSLLGISGLLLRRRKG